MSTKTILREAKYIKADLTANNNKWWDIKEFDDNTCFVTWGRVGETGDTQTKVFSSPHEASKFFDSKCREKERKGYQPQKTIEAGKTVITSAPAGSLKDLALKQIKTNSPLVTNLIERLAAANVHNILQSTTLTYNAQTGLFSTPLGIVTKEGIDQARVILTQMASFVKKGDFDNPIYHHLISKYLMLIPQAVGRKLDARVLYPNLVAIQNQNGILDSLEASLQLAIQTPTTVENKIIDEPKLFEARLHLVDDKTVIEGIRKLYKSTLQRNHACAHLDLKTAYEITIDTMHENFEKHGKKLGNIMRLWHGTRAGNLLSIIKGGYIIPPANASYCTGRMFGNGVYFSDQSTKSLNYAYGYWDGKGKDNNCFMLLNDVSMGKAYTPRNSYESLPKTGFDSTFAKAGQSGVINNEMIVYSLNQINPVYLLEFSPGGN